MLSSRVDALELIQCLASTSIAKAPRAICCRLLNKTGFQQVTLFTDSNALVQLIAPYIQTAIGHAEQGITITLTVDESQLSLAFVYDNQLSDTTSCNMCTQVVLEHELPDLVGAAIKVNIRSDDPKLKRCLHSFEQHMNIECVCEEAESSGSHYDIEIRDARDSARYYEHDNTDNPIPIVTMLSMQALTNEPVNGLANLYWPFFDSDLHSILGDVKQLKKPKVLVADDSKPSKMATMVMLEHLGCHVIGAEDGTEALELASQQSFDLIFLDERMPGLFGSAVAYKLIENKGLNQHTPKVSLTGITEKDSIEQLYSKGITHHIHKPVTKLILENFLAQWRKS